MTAKKLSPREKEVIILKMNGLCDKEIAGRLNISYGTVRSHIDRAKLKLKLYKEAAEDLLKSIELGNSNEDIYFNIGFSYYKLSYFKDALYYFNKEERIQPS